MIITGAGLLAARKEAKVAKETEKILNADLLAKLKEAVEADPKLKAVVKDQQARMPEASYERVLTVLWGLNAL